MPLETQGVGRPAGGGSRRFSLSPAAMSLVALGVLLVLGWCFYMGFMIGRGQNPEEHLQKIAAIWQGENRPPAAADTIAAGSSPAAPVTEEQTVDTAGQAPQAPAQAQAQAQAQPQAPAQGSFPGYPSFGTPLTQPQPQAQVQPQTQAAPQQAKAQAQLGTYTYTYRMATVRSQEDARKEQERYEGRGFRVSIRRSGNAWFLQHTFQGTDKDEAQFLKEVKKAGLGDPMRVSRKKN